MRRCLTFECEGATLAATLDEGSRPTGLLIVSGGNEIRIGAHRGMAKLAADIAAAGHPVFRFDRRGIGDSEGDNAGFEGSAPDIAAALAAFRTQCPALHRIVAFGNCDAATAILLHGVDGLDAAILANPWTIEAQPDDAPPPAAIKAHYLQKLRDPKAVWRLISGGVNLRKLAGGIAKAASKAPPSPLAMRVGSALARFPGSVRLLLAASDATAAVFLDEWDKPHFAQARQRPDVSMRTLDSRSHSFAEASDYAALREECLAALG